MRKKLFLLAVAAAALASCSSDETLSVNQGLEDANSISFRPAIQGMTRAANGTGLKSAFETGDRLYVNAIRNTSPSKTMYFQDQFVRDASGFNSSAKHFWPADLATNSITFTAFWGVPYKTVDPASSYSAYGNSPGDEFLLNGNFTVADEVANQKDILFAMSSSITARPADGKVTLNFRHMLSQIVVKVANDQENLEIDVTGVRVGHVVKTGTFTYSGSSTGTQVIEATSSTYTNVINRTNWGDLNSSAALPSALHDQTLTTITLDGKTAAQSLTGYGFKSWILMPQQLTAPTDYTARANPGAVTPATTPTINGAYLALKMAIKDKVTDVPIVAEQWCYWPINTEWKPGYRYTYTINAGSGGYQPTDQNNTVGLDPVLDNLVIWFAPACTIDQWVPENYGISAPIARTASYAFAAAGAQTINLDAGANGTYDITITGLTEGHTVTASATNNFTGAPTVSDSGTVPANGTLTITGTLTANTTAAVSSVITITDTSASQSMTITIIQAAPAN